MLLLGAIAIVAYGVLGEFLIGNKLLLFTDIGSDTFYNYFANYHLITGYVSNLQLPTWSFKLGAGASLLTLYQFLYDPFSIIFYLGGVENLSRAIAWAYALKVLCAGIFTWVYLRTIGIGNEIRTIIALLFAFNGFLMVFGQHYFYASWIIFLPLLLYTIEVGISDSKWWPLALCTAYLALNIAICWQIAILSSFYVAFRIGIEWPQKTQRQWRVTLAGALLAGVLGLGLSAVFWLPEFHVLRASPRISINSYDAVQQTLAGFFHLFPSEYYWSLIARLFSNNLQGIGSEYFGYLNYYESLQLYAGILPLVVIPQLYSVFTAREKWAASFAIIILVVCLSTPGFSQLMNGFQYPHQRWGYTVIMLELVLAAVVLDRMIKKSILNVRVLVVTALALLGCLVLLYFKSGELASGLHHYTRIRLFQIAVLVLAYCLALAWTVQGRSRRMAFSVLLALVCVELIAEHHDSFTKRSVLQKGIENDTSINYFDYGKLAVKHLNETDPTFYRVEKNHWILSLNDSLIQDYRGIDSYQSLNSPGYIDFLKQSGYSFRNLNVVYWNSLSYPELADILSVKYHLTKDVNSAPRDSKLLGHVGDVFVYKRANHLPFGFTYDSYIPKSAFSLLPIEERGRALLQGVVLDGPPLEALKKITHLGPASDDDRFRDILRKDVLRDLSVNDDVISGTLDTASSKLLFLSVPYDPGWSAEVNGNQAELYKANSGFIGLFVEPGRSRITLRYTPPLMKTGAALTVFCILLFLTLYFVRRRKASLASSLNGAKR